MKRTTIFLPALTATLSTLLMGCSGMFIKSSLWDIAEKYGKDQVFAASVNGDVRRYVWVSEELNPMGKKDISLSLGWGTRNKEKIWVSGGKRIPQKSIAYAYQRALKRGEGLLKGQATIMDVRKSYYYDRESNAPNGKIHVLMSTPIP